MRKALISFVTLVAAATALAGTTGSLAGRVIDDAGSALPGASVTISSPALIGGARTEAAGADGSFGFPAIAPGVYTVKVELSGFAAQELTEVQVRLDRTTTLEVTLALAKFADEVQVIAESPVVDRTQVSASQTYTSDYMQQSAIGSANRTYQAVISQTAGVAGENVLGSTSGDNAYFIDGLDTTDPVAAGAGTNLNFDVIQEISFQIGGFEAEYGRATGGVVNLITKSGGNELSGTLDIRYRDDSFYEEGDHFDTDAQDASFLKPSLTLGGPVLRDRLWFFVGYERPSEESTPAGAQTTTDTERQNWLGKLTWQVNPSWRLVAKTSGNPGTIDNGNSSPIVEPEAAYGVETDTTVYQVEVLGTLTPDLLWSFQVGANTQQVDLFPQSGDLETIGHMDLVTGVFSKNYFNAQYSDRDRTEVKTSLTYFADDWGGSHELKAGVEYDDTHFTFHSFLPGGFLYADAVGTPYVLMQVVDQGVQEYPGTILGAYAQDAWRPHPNVTLKLGLRWDSSTFDSPDGSEFASLDLVQPRIGVAWDVAGDGKTIVRGTYGRFMHPSALTLPTPARGVGVLGQYVSCSAFVAPRPICDAVAASLGTIVIDDPGGDYPGEGWMLTQPYSPLANQAADGLAPTYVDTFIVGAEREIARRTSVELQYVAKDTNDLFDNTCNGNWPGPPAAGAPCSYYIIANLPELKREYRGVIARVESRATDWLHVLGSYTYSTSKGSIEYTQASNDDFDYYPWHYDNRYGYLSDHREHRVKLNGYVQLPYDFTIGAGAYWESAFHWTPTTTFTGDPGVPLPYGVIFTEPRGSREANSSYQVDLQIAKGFKVGAVRMQLIGTVLNLLDSERPIQVCESVTGCGAAATGAPMNWQQPRHYEVGLRLEF